MGNRGRKEEEGRVEKDRRESIGRSKEDKEWVSIYNTPS